MSIEVAVQKLRQELECFQDLNWARVAIAKLNQSEIRYFTTPGRQGSTAARELLWIYGIRLARSREIGASIPGLAELVAWLETLPPTERVKIEGFLVGNSILTAFYGPNEMLGACVTVNNFDPNRGGGNFNRAMRSP